MNLWIIGSLYTSTVPRSGVDEFEGPTRKQGYVLNLLHLVCSRSSTTFQKIRATDFSPWANVEMFASHPPLA